MDITLKIPTAKATAFKNYLTTKFGYTATIQDPAKPEDPEATIPNPESANAFCKRQIAEMLQRDFKSWKRQEANRLAQEAVTDTIEIS